MSGKWVETAAKFLSYMLGFLAAFFYGRKHKETEVLKESLDAAKEARKLKSRVASDSSYRERVRENYR